MATRRDFVRVIGATSVAGLISGSIHAAEEDPVVDAHVHVWTPDTQAFPLSTKFTKADMQPASFTPRNCGSTQLLQVCNASF